MASDMIERIRKAESDGNKKIDEAKEKGEKIIKEAHEKTADMKLESKNKSKTLYDEIMEKAKNDAKNEEIKHLEAFKNEVAEERKKAENNRNKAIDSSIKLLFT